MLQGKETTIHYARAFQRGEEEAYDYFFRLYFQALCFFARTILPIQHPPEDLVQECFIRLWEKHWDIKKPDAIRTFLYTTVRNACIDLIRKKKVIPTVSLPDELPAEDQLANWRDGIAKAELLREILAYAEQLPFRLQQVIHLYYTEGKTDEEIGKEFNTSYLTVRNQRSKAIKLLKKKFS